MHPEWGGIDFALPSPGTLGLTVLCTHGYGGAAGKYQDVIFSRLSFHLVCYKVDNKKICLYYKCMLNRFFLLLGA